MAPSELPGMDCETLEMIEDQVKKGKARKFLLIYKGESIKRLEVFKKGPFGPRIMRAKKEGFKGDVACGIVTGSGKELSFQLAGNDQVAAAMKVDSIVEKGPTETAKLRKFLSDHGLAFKPDYVIVTDASLALNAEVDDEAPLASSVASSVVAESADSTEQTPADVAPPVADVAPVSKSMESPVVPETPAASPEQSSDLSSADGVTRRDALQQRFDALQPKISAAGAVMPDVAEELEDLAIEFRECMKINDLDVAQEWLAKLEETANLVPAEAPPPAVDPLKRDFETRLKELTPKMALAGQTGGERGAALMALLRTVQAQRAAGDFTAGLNTLVQVEQLLATPAPTSGPSELQRQFDALLKTHASPAVAAIRAGSPQSAELSDLLKQIQADRNTGAYASGIEKLHRVAELLSYAAPSPSPPSQDASDLIGSMAIWHAARQAAVAQIREVAQACADTKDPDARGAIIELQSIIKNLTLTPDTPQAVAELERYLRTDDVIVAAEEVPPQFGSLKLREPLLEALASLAR